MRTETIDKLFLELSQFTQATTDKESDMSDQIIRLRSEVGRHLARSGETEYAVIKRNRSGQSSGEVDFALPPNKHHNAEQFYEE
jgi:hypothetical protein